MNSASKINVIIPVYNVEQYLEQCVRFILEQSYSVFERLLVDDGSTDGSGELCERARRSAAVNDIVFLGRRDDPQNFFSQVDICVMPSLWEGLTLVLLEALSGGVPVVANACDGILDVLRDGENGLLVAPADAGAHVAALELLCNDASLCDRLGAKERSDYEKEYSFETWREGCLDFYREAMR